MSLRSLFLASVGLWFVSCAATREGTFELMVDQSIEATMKEHQKLFPNFASTKLSKKLYGDMTKDTLRKYASAEGFATPRVYEAEKALTADDIQKDFRNLLMDPRVDDATVEVVFPEGSETFIVKRTHSDKRDVDDLKKVDRKVHEDSAKDYLRRMLSMYHELHYKKIK